MDLLQAAPFQNMYPRPFVKGAFPFLLWLHESPLYVMGGDVHVKDLGVRLRIGIIDTRAHTHTHVHAHTQRTRVPRQ